MPAFVDPHWQLVVGATGVLLLSLVAYRLLFSPLARLPGPVYTAVTRYPLIYHEFSGQRRRFVHRLHLRYGPIVRIAPDEVSFASSEAAKEIYSSHGSGYDKSSFYRLFANFDRPNMFSTLEKGQHADFKRRFAERYTKAYVTKADVVFAIQQDVDAFLAKVAENTGNGKSLDVFTFLHCFALDVITSHLFYPSGLHAITDQKDRMVMEGLAYSDGWRSGYLPHRFPTLHRIHSKLRGLIVRKQATNGLLLEDYILETARAGTVASHTVLAKLRAAHSLQPLDADDPIDPTSDAHGSTPSRDWMLAASECMDHAAAGFDTTGDALCFLMHHLSQRTPAPQRVQARLRAELAAHPGAPADALPYLDAVVKEGLRMFSPIPMSLPRVVPAGGRVVAGAVLPAGTVVSCQAYTMHRLDARVFPDPDEFVPERWLEEDGAREREQMFFAFAAGGRGCIGKHLALLEMKLLLKAIYSAYRTVVAPEMKASMEQEDLVISSRPEGKTCLIVFEATDR